MNGNQKYVCPKCNGLVDYGVRFCPHCGNAFGSWGESSAGTVTSTAKENLITEAEYHFAKTRLAHGLLSTVIFKGTQVTVKQVNKWLPFVKSNAGFAQFDVMDIESAYIKKSYNTMMCVLLALCLVVLLLSAEFILLVLTGIIAFSLRDTALIIKYKGGYLKLFNDKDPFNTEKHDDPQLVLDYIKQYNPDSVHVLMD